MKNEKIMSNKQTILLVVGIFLASLLIIGGTYAYLVFDIEITNKNIVGNTTCFDIVYDITNDDDSTPITGTLIPSSGPGGGLSGKVSIGISSSCNIDAYGNFYLNVLTGGDVLFQTVDAHCENSQTLRTLINYTDQTSCEGQTNGVWVTDGTALKYAIYTTNNITSTTVPIQVGYINDYGMKTIYENFPLQTTLVDYYIYIWLDGNLADNSYASQSFVGNISAAASQVEMESISSDSGDVYAIYSETDNSLRFYNNNDISDISVGSDYRGRTITAVYTDFENNVYSSSSIPWYDYVETVELVDVEETISPLNTKYWFNNFTNCSYFDVSKLSMSNVTDASYMFYYAGYNTSSFEIVGMDSWNTSNVTDMQYMFRGAGYSATSWDVGYLSGWDTSKVTNMKYMFSVAGRSATTWGIIGDLSGWDTSNVTDMSFMFDSFGYSSTNWSVGDLSEWTTSNVTDMRYMFCNAGYSNTGNWSVGDLSGWDTSGVTNMKLMFSSAGYNSSTFSLPGLGSWVTSNVTDMSYMFYYAGYSDSSWSLDLSGWNVNNVTTYSYFNTGVTSKVTAPTWVN